MIQWQHFVILIVFVAALIVGVVMASEGNQRIRANRPKGKLLFWLGGPVAGLSTSGMFMWVILQESLLTVLLFAFLFSVLVWGVVKFIHRFG